MKGWLRSAVSHAGFYYAKRQYMPVGIDWLWDVHRIIGGRRLRTTFDVGANVGHTTTQIKDRFPDTTVHAFEPVPETFERLRRQVEGLNGVTPHRLALSDRTGTATMTADPGSPLNHLVGDDSRSGNGVTTRVDCDTLDRFCEQQQISSIDLLKVDAEGADLKVLQGAATLFRERCVALLFAEVGFDVNDTGHVHLAVLFDHLSRAGFEPYAFYDYCRLLPPAYEREGLGLVFANVLFVSPEALARWQ
jgi:FkbM family methyltransferase